MAYDDYVVDLRLADNALKSEDHSTIKLNYGRLKNNILRLEELDTEDPHKKWLSEHKEMISKLEKVLGKRTANRFASPIHKA